MTGCVSQQDKIEAKANSVLSGVGGSQAHFSAEAAEICKEMPQAETPFVPPLGKVCSRGCFCSSAAKEGTDPRTTYDCDLWKTREWELIKFAGTHSLDGSVNPNVYVHYRASWQRTKEGCTLEFTLHGDLDEDGVYSTYVSAVFVTPEGADGTRSKRSVLWE